MVALVLPDLGLKYSALMKTVIDIEPLPPMWSKAFSVDFDEVVEKTTRSIFCHSKESAFYYGNRNPILVFGR